VGSLFVDTSAFVALADKSDRNHRAAKSFLKLLARERRPLLTSTYIADEAITVVGMSLGHTAAVEVGEAILTSEWCQLMDIDEGLRKDAWAIFRRYDDQTFSFTDCTSFAVMKNLELKEAFTFDRRDFAAAGFVPLPAETSRK
jgi:uncharacterized protein